MLCFICPLETDGVPDVTSTSATALVSGGGVLSDAEIRELLLSGRQGLRGRLMTLVGSVRVRGQVAFRRGEDRIGEETCTKAFDEACACCSIEHLLRNVSIQGGMNTSRTYLVPNLCIVRDEVDRKPICRWLVKLCEDVSGGIVLKNSIILENVQVLFEGA